MVEEVLSNLFRIPVPLPQSPLKSINSYIFIGPERNLVVDTGMNRDECRTVLDAGFKEISLDLERTDFFITHLHSDHSGLVAHFATDSSLVYFNKTEAEFIAKARKTGEFSSGMSGLARKSGFPEQELQESLSSHPGRRFGMPELPEFTIVVEGDTLRFGDFELECISTPGHTPGHMCLYEPNKKFFVAGDHILGDITPNISSWSEDLNPLGDYLVSLDKVYGLDVDLVLPGHRSLFKDFRGRIDELKLHHRERADEILVILEDGAKVAYHVAAKMTWSLRVDSWEEVPAMQKWFATGEAIAHLEYLESEGAIRRETQGEDLLFMLS